jgi:sulfotransferase
MKKFCFLSGLPRSGSTILSCVLDQNPLIHAEGNSGVCQVMWDTQVSVNKNQQILANKRFDTKLDLCASVPQVYYKNQTKPIILDKCRSWTLPDNLRMIYSFITKSPKIIVLQRPIEEIIISYANLMAMNGHFENIEQIMLTPLTDPLMRSYDGVIHAKNNNNGEFIFINYSEMLSDIQGVVDKIYIHCGWEKFDHQYTDIVNNHPEDDGVYNFLGQHDIRSTIGKRQLDFKLSNETLDICKKMNEVMFS